MKKIKNIIFDLGGVFIDVNYLRTKEVFESLGILNFDDYFMQHHSNPLFSDLEKGLISPDFFLKVSEKKPTATYPTKKLQPPGMLCWAIIFRKRSTGCFP